MKHLPADLLFQRADWRIQDNPLLREPQREAHWTVKRHFQKSREPAILQMPVGCGKTGVMAILPFDIAHGRVLLIAPNTTIRDGLTHIEGDNEESPAVCSLNSLISSMAALELLVRIHGYRDDRNAEFAAYRFGVNTGRCEARPGASRRDE